MGHRTIVIIDDEEAIRDVFVLALEIEGYLVSTAANGKEGLELLRSIRAPCLILLDLMMPVMNGWEFLEAVRKEDHLSTIPIIVVTAFAEHAKAIRAQGVLIKPIQLPALLKTVQIHCGG